MDVARVFVGSDPNQGKAELALEYSIRKHASIPFEIYFMRPGTDPFWEDWAMNWQFSQEKAAVGWHHTQFTCFRYAIPGFCDYTGKAIYMDSDQIMLRDIAELWNMPQSAPWKCVAQKRTCVSLIQCGPFAKAEKEGWWPTKERIKGVNKPGVFYRDLMVKHGYMDPTLSNHWNCADGVGFDSEKTGILHYTSVYTQPWKPHEGKIQSFAYKDHPRAHIAKLWWDYYNEASSSEETVDAP